MTGVLARIDHLVYAARDLDLAIDALERRLGVRAAPGGSHPGRGTRNALLALGPASYLEILAPDPAQLRAPTRRWLGVDEVHEPRLTTWAVKATNLAQRAALAKAQGIPLGEVRQGARTRMDGVQLSWELTEAPQLIAGGLVPFFIDWGQSPHPAETAAQGLQLVELRGEHPQPASVRQMLDALGIKMRVESAPATALVASVQSPMGTVELR
jgi:hypothetical protein